MIVTKAATSRRIALTATLVALVLDQVTKTWMVQGLGNGPHALPGPFGLRLVANRGVLLGIPAPTWLLTAAVIVVLAIAFQASGRASPRAAIAYGMLAGGALGNSLDRLLDRSGFPDGAVVDWIAYEGITFNLADAFMLVAVVLLLGRTGSESEPSESCVAANAEHS